MQQRTWALAVDYGTSNTVAAVVEAGPRVRLLQFGGHISLPSAVYVEPDGERRLLTGASAERAGAADAQHLVPTPKQHVGQEQITVGAEQVPVRTLIATTLQTVFREAWRQQDNTAPDVVTITHPVAWGPPELAALRAAARQALPDNAAAVHLDLVPEPVAAAWHAAQSRLVPPRARIAVLDLGGGTCDVALVDRDGDNFRLVGAPLGVSPLGGEDFDARLLQHVLQRTQEPGRKLTPEQQRRLRVSCREVKEHLSTLDRASVPVPSSDGTHEVVQVWRAEHLEPLLLADGPARPGLDTAAGLVDQALREAGPPPGPVFVFLIGGSSRIPLLSRLVLDTTGLPPLEHGDPGTAVAEGAARMAVRQLRPVPAAFAAGHAGRPTRSRRPLWIGLGAAGAAVLLAGAFLLVPRLTNAGPGSEVSPSPVGPAPTPVADPMGDGTLTIATLTPSTGPWADRHRAQRAGAEAAARDINDAGGVHGTPVELHQFDARSLTAARQSASELQAADVDVAITSLQRTGATAIVPALTEDGVAVISSGDGVMDLAAGDDLYFRTAPTDVLEGQALGNRVIADGHRRVAVLHVSDEYGSSVVQGLRTSIGTEGEFAAEPTGYQPAATVFTDQVAAVRATQPDAIILIGHHESPTVVRELIAQGMGPGQMPLYLSGDAYRDYTVLPAGAMEGATGVLPGALASDVAQTKMTEVDSSLEYFDNGPEAYDAVILAALASYVAGDDAGIPVAAQLRAVSEGGELCRRYADCVSLLDQGHDIDYEGQSGSVDLDDAGRITQTTVRVFTFDGSNQPQNAGDVTS